MATGSLYSGRCYTSQPEAVDAYYSAAIPNVTAGATSYHVYFIKVAGNWLSVTSSKTEAGNWIAGTPVNASAPTFAACDSNTEQFLDGMAVGWAIAGAMVLAFGARLVRSKVR